MPRYIYTAKSEPTKTSHGRIEAESEQDAINKLTRMGLFPLTIAAEALSLHPAGLIQFRKISRKEIVAFTRQLSSLIESGINILNALNILTEQATNKYLGAILSDISGKIRDGTSLSDSLGAYPDLFPHVYCAMVRSGEAGGDLKNTLKKLADFLEESEEFRDSLRSSLTYPFFVIAVSIITVIILLAFVIPRLTAMFEDMGELLPLPTRILIATSSLLRNSWWVIAFGIFIIIFLSLRLLKNPKSRFAFDRFRLKIPVFGPLILKTETSRLTRTLSLLLSSGMPITPALDISSQILNNQALKAEVMKFKDKINNGSSFSEAFKDSKLFPVFVTNIVGIGEETGALDSSLMRISSGYEKEARRTLNEFTRLLEPAIILIMGLIVGFIVISMLLPVFQINLMVR